MDKQEQTHRPQGEPELQRPPDALEDVEDLSPDGDESDRVAGGNLQPDFKLVPVKTIS